jgi:hypothetical protein
LRFRCGCRLPPDALGLYLHRRRRDSRRIAWVLWASLTDVAGPRRIVDVGSLPWPHLLFKCRWRDRFVLASEAPAALTECPYPAIDWHAAAAAAVALVEAGDASTAAIARAARERKLDPDTSEALFNFFADPIFCSGESLGNGQHRVCAMKLAKVPRCPIEE